MSDLLLAPRATKDSKSLAGARTGTSGQLSAQASRLLRGAEGQLRLARRPDDIFERFSHTHFAALRLAGAVLVLTETAKRIPRGHSVWDRLGHNVPTFNDWAQIFERSAKIRAALELGNFAVINQNEVERWITTVEEFRVQVFQLFGLDPLLDFDSQYRFVA